MKTRHDLFRYAVRQGQSRRSLALLVLAAICAAATTAALMLQPRSVRSRYYGWSTTATIRHADGSIEQPTLQTRSVFVLRTQFRGIFAIEVFDYVQNEAPPAMGKTPINLPAGATASFANPAYMNGDFESTTQIVELSVPTYRLSGFYNGESRFIGRVWLRREVLWTLFGISLALAVTAGTPIALHGRKLRRFKRGLCARCAYPLLMEQDEPICPECGTRHIP